jgi:hypothetical protein
MVSCEEGRPPELIRTPFSYAMRGFKVGPTGLSTLVADSPYFPLGDGAGGEIGGYPIDPIIEATLGWPSSMVTLYRFYSPIDLVVIAVAFPCDAKIWFHWATNRKQLLPVCQ